jgi:hypothetical protein
MIRSESMLPHPRPEDKRKGKQKILGSKAMGKALAKMNE